MELSNDGAGTREDLLGMTPDGASPNAPDLNSELTPKRRAITSVEQLNNIISNLEKNSEERNRKNAKIAEKYNGSSPYDQKALEAEGLGWKSNFTTKPLATAIDKIGPRLTKAVHSARYLTSAELPETVEGGKTKTETFRKLVTKTIRSWPGWRPFLNELAAENSTFGYTSLAWLSPYSWRPTHFRQDRFNVPDQTKQTASFCPVWVGKQELQIHEMVQMIDDPDSARAAGWDLEAAIETVNSASPRSLGATGDLSSERRTYEDAIRESSVALSFQQGAKIIEVWHCFVAEADGQVSYYLVDAKNERKLLRKQEDLYASMSEALAFMSYQQANGLLMGSKGVGRELYEVSCALDRARNEFVDRLLLSGKVWVKGTAKALERLRLSVVGDLVLLDDNYETRDVKIDAGAESFAILDQQITQLMDQIAGGVTPKQFQGDRVTSTEVNLYAAREEEKRDDITERFLLQLADAVSNIQRRLVDPETDDADAKKLRAELLRHMNEDELKELADQPALRTVDDWTADEAQAIILFAQEKRNDPLYDQVKLARKAASARISPDFAEDVILAVNDPTQEAEQVRAQTLESLAITLGSEIPVSPRDNHRIHADVLKEEMKTLVQQLAQDPTLAQIIQAKAAHWAQHFELALQGGALPEDWEEDKQMLAALQSELQPLTEPAAEQPAV